MDPKILLIDDDRLQYRLTRAHFNNFAGRTYGLDYADTYELGLARLLTGTYAACLLDYRLGERDGLQLIREAISEGCHTPIVFLTAESSEAVDIQAMEAGALDYLVKGEITPRLLERSLRYALKLGETLKALHKLATHDELTGLINRREFERGLTEETERARRFGHPCGLVMIDLDHFKAVNDRFGHPAGDQVLRQIARRLLGLVQRVDRVARLGGEEFAFLLFHADKAAALEMANRACHVAAQAPVVLEDGTQVAITVSAGAAAFPADGMNSGDLVGAADRALYLAKAGGRNRAVGAAPLPASA